MRTTARPFGPVVRIFFGGKTLFVVTACSCLPDASLIATPPSALIISRSSPPAEQVFIIMSPARQKTELMLNLAARMAKLTYELLKTIRLALRGHGYAVLPGRQPA